MRRLFSIYTALMALLLLVAPVAAAAEATASVPPLDRVYEVIEDFIREDYLSSWFASPQLIRRHFADPLDYYWGKENVALQSVLEDKIAYVTRWPQRYYRLIDDSLTVSRTEVDASTYAVTFKYEFETRRIGDQRSGLGQTDLIVRMVDDVITIRGEGGRVLERH